MAVQHTKGQSRIITQLYLKFEGSKFVLTCKHKRMSAAPRKHVIYFGSVTVSLIQPSHEKQDMQPEARAGQSSSFLFIKDYHKPRTVNSRK